MVQGSVRYLMGPVMAQDFRYQRGKRLGKTTEGHLLPLRQKMEHRSAHPAKRQEYLLNHLDSKKADPIISLSMATQRDIQSPKVME